MGEQVASTVSPPPPPLPLCSRLIIPEEKESAPGVFPVFNWEMRSQISDVDMGGHFYEEHFYSISQLDYLKILL